VMFVLSFMKIRHLVQLFLREIFTWADRHRACDIINLLFSYKISSDDTQFHCLEVVTHDLKGHTKPKNIVVSYSGSCVESH